MGLLMRWLVSAGALLIVAWLFDKIWFDTVGAAFLAALVLGLINAFIKPVVQLFTLPVTVLTMGIFALVINAALLMLTSSLVSGFHVEGFWTAFWGSIVLAVVSGVLGALFGED